MFNYVAEENIFVKSANGLTRGEKITLLSFGLTLGVAGTYGLWLDTAGRYEEMGMLFFLWLLLQIPANIVMLLLAFLFGILHFPLLVFLITFIWWFLLGSFFAFISIFFINYYAETYSE